MPRWQSNFNKIQGKLASEITVYPNGHFPICGGFILCQSNHESDGRTFEFAFGFGVYHRLGSFFCYRESAGNGSTIKTFFSNKRT